VEVDDQKLEPVEDDEQMLPRGGKQLRQQREKDVDEMDEVFGVSDDGGEAGTAAAAAEQSGKKSRSRRLRVLSRGTVQVGALLMGVVSGVFEAGMKLDLPHGIHGYVSSLQISSEYTAQLQSEDDDQDAPDLADMFHVGDLVAACVVGYRQHMINVTLDPEVVAQYLSADSGPALVPGLFALGVVQSTEDNGWLVKLSGSGKTAFCPKNAAPSPHWGIPGRPVFVAVTQCSERLIEVSGYTCSCSFAWLSHC
jgi:hypothetical protein